MTRSAREQGDMAVATDGTLSLELNASLNAVLTIRIELGGRSTGLLTDDADVSFGAPTAMLHRPSRGTAWAAPWIPWRLSTRRLPTGMWKCVW